MPCGICGLERQHASAVECVRELRDLLDAERTIKNIEKDRPEATGILPDQEAKIEDLVVDSGTGGLYDKLKFVSFRCKVLVNAKRAETLAARIQEAHHVACWFIPLGTRVAHSSSELWLAQ